MHEFIQVIILEVVRDTTVNVL